MSLLAVDKESDSIQLLAKRFQEVRDQSIKLCTPLKDEDYVVQPVVDVSPPKWHLAHTTWFFETFVLIPLKKDYQVFDKQFGFLFNSYYESVGAKAVRVERGNMTRPTVSEVKDYRNYVDIQMIGFFEEIEELSEDLMKLMELGLQHEQQHQELLVYDVKRILGGNPIFPPYLEHSETKSTTELEEANWLSVSEGIYDIGHQEKSFSFDNELGAHKVFLHAFEVQSRLVTNGEYLEFIQAGGYEQFKYWLSEGWGWVKTQEFKSPKYWFLIDGDWMNYQLVGGLQPLDMNAPVTHVSYFEADAFARWKGLRIPTEFEWETAAKIFAPTVSDENNFVEDNKFAPQASQNGNNQFFGDVWEWTSSSYLPYPYFTIEEGAIGEYNGKFMVNQMVLRGGSCATPKDHIRHTYRNFFPAELKWFFNGIRLARHI